MTRRREWPTVLLVVGAGIVSAFQVGKAPLVLPAVQAELAMGLGTAAWLLSAFAILGAVAGVVIGLVIGRSGARRMTIAGLLLQGLAGGAGAFADSASWLLASRVAEGLGFLTVTVAAPALIVAIVSAEGRSRAIALWGLFMPAGIALVMLGAPLLDPLGWRGFWLANAGIVFSYAALVAIGTRHVATPPPAGSSIFGDLRQILAIPAPWRLGLFMASFGAIYFAVFGFLPTILGERLGVDAGSASLLTAFAVAVNALGNLACGALLARGMSHRSLLATGFGAMALCGAGIFHADIPGSVAYLLCVAFSGIGGLLPVALLDAAPRSVSRPHLAGAAIGLVMQGNNAGLVLGPAVAGALAEAAGWPAVSWLVAAVALASLLLAVMTDRNNSLTAREQP